MTWLIVIVSAVLAVIRISGHKSQAYQAVAHLWVGWLVGLWTLQRGAIEWYAFWALGVVEVSCFVWFRLYKPTLNPDQTGARSGVQGMRAADSGSWAGKRDPN